MKRTSRTCASKSPSEGRKKKREASSRRTKGTSRKASEGDATENSSSVRSEPRSPRSKATRKAQAVPAPDDSCRHCSKDLTGDERALFVEEEVGRIFCTEDCIAAYFSPDIERLEKEYHRRHTSGDLTSSEREGLNHLRWITLQEPEEVWREKTLTGDFRYTLISEFHPGNRRIWCVCICLFLRGEPSFLYLAFPTRNAAMANQYRRGERVEWVRNHASATEGHAMDSDGLAATSSTIRAGSGEAVDSQTLSDRLAEPWTEEETLRARITSERSDDDIPLEEFSLYHSCLEETLETPHELWVVMMGPEAEEGAEHAEHAEHPEPVEHPEHAEQGDHGEQVRIYHFIRHYSDERPGVWYIVVARETDDEEEIEILDAFPTRDAALVDRYRRGEQEIGHTEDVPANRVIH